MSRKARTESLSKSLKAGMSPERGKLKEMHFLTVRDVQTFDDFTEDTGSHDDPCFSF